MSRSVKMLRKKLSNKFKSLCKEADNIASCLYGDCDILRDSIKSGNIDVNEVRATVDRLEGKLHTFTIKIRLLENLDVDDAASHIFEYNDVLQGFKDKVSDFHMCMFDFKEWIYDKGAVETQVNSSRDTRENEGLIYPGQPLQGSTRESEGLIDPGQPLHGSTGELSASDTSEVNITLLKQAELKVKAKALKRKKELQLAMLKLETEIEDLDLQTELDITRAKLTVLGQIDSDENKVSPRYEELDDNVGIKTRSNTATQPSRDIFKANLTNNNSLLSQTSVLEGMLVSALKKPQVEIKPFSGEPTEFKLFMRQFGSKVSQYCSTKDEEMNYLMQFTEGEPHRIVKGFSHLPAETGFRAALEELTDRYGNPDVIAAKYVRKALEWTVIKAENVKLLDDYAIFLTEIDYAMQNLESVRVLENPDNLRKLVQKLPYTLQERWRNKVFILEENELGIRFSDFANFVKRESKKANHPIYGKSAATNEPWTKSTRAKTYATSTSTTNDSGSSTTNGACVYCKGNHWLNECDKFGNIQYEDRVKFVYDNRRCFGCLRFGHMKSKCFNVEECKKCSLAHPTVLHKEVKNSSNNVNEMEKDCCTLAIVPVQIRRKNSPYAKTILAFLDPGSTVSFISNKVMNELGCTGLKKRMDLSTMGDVHTMHSYVIKNLEIMNVEGDNVIQLPSVYSKEQIPVDSNFMVQQCDIEKWPHLRHLNLPELRGEVGILIGNNVPSCMMPLELRTGPEGSPYAAKTKLGWVVWGLMKNDNEKLLSCKSSVESIREIEYLNNLDERMRDFMNCEFPEKLIDDQKEMSLDDQEFVRKTTESVKLVNGRYEMKIPFKSDNVVLPNNFQYALSRLRGLRRKLKKDESLASEYNSFMNDLISKGYCEKVDLNENIDDGKVWYIPHHAVRHPRKRKLRVVFDCAASYLGVSLNDHILSGPNLTTPLIDVLLRFRLNRIGIMADIEQMFYRVLVPKEERNFMRFLWYSNGELDKDPIEYRMGVHSFGLVSSPACAVTALRMTAEDNRDKYDATILDCIYKHTYIDDLLVSCESVEKAKKITTEFSELCSKGGFVLKDWCSNDRKVVEVIPESKRSKGFQNLDFQKDQMPEERALGLWWCTENDVFKFKVQIKPARTRREILSVVYSVYDPIGLISPFILPAKLLLQKLCKLNLGWDEVINLEEEKLWKKWIESIKNLENISIDRCLKPSFLGNFTTELHTFADASDSGYGVCVYLRFVNETEGNIDCKLVTSRSRVAPLKKVTIPKLELNAAKLAVMVTHRLLKELNLSIDKRFFWSDSTAVLKTINSKETRFPTFVQNRLRIIHEGSNSNDWHYINSSCNPADMCSRGCFAETSTEKMKEWLNPSILRQPSTAWPSDIKDSVTSMSEVCYSSNERDCKISVVAAILNKFSSWEKARRVMGWVMLACKNFRKKGGKPFELSVEHLKEAEMKLIQHEQKLYFDEFKDGRVNLKRGSKLLKLDPIVKDEVVRVGGRLSNAPIEYNAQHPIILPKESKISRLIINDCHKKFGHIGKNFIMSELRQRYWIIGAAGLVKKMINSCVLCKKYRVQLCKQKMSDLPLERVTPLEAPFSHCGADFAGNFMIKRGRALVKRYLMVFTCMNSRAVHLEVAYSLDTSSCINAIRRFSSRRGGIKTLRSDNGGNLVGAEKELKEVYSKLNQKAIARDCVNKGIEWNFNCPASSHHGGVWERMIRSVRQILYSLIKENHVSLDDESFLTLVCEVEAILNNRPLTTVSSDHTDLSPLTPNDLLQPMNDDKFHVNCEESDKYSRKRWKQIQYLTNIFWKRWAKEYLSTLQQRQKWHFKESNLEIDDIVMLVESNVKSSYTLAKITEVFKDKNGLVRTVEIKTKDGKLKRPIVKLCLILKHDSINGINLP